MRPLYHYSYIHIMRHRKERGDDFPLIKKKKEEMTFFFKASPTVMYLALYLHMWRAKIKK
jgi:hypothetical protein